MKYKLPHALIALLLMGSLVTKAQSPLYDTIKVLTYNIANYGFTSSGCPTLLTSFKNPLLRSIVDYESPDIIGFEKMNASPATLSTDTIVQNVLDSVCQGCYGHAIFTNASGYSKEDMLYYRTSKLGFESTTVIYSADNSISDITLHKLYYKSPSLPVTHDTIFLNIILVHLESGSGSADQRGTEVAGAIEWLNSNITAPGNYIFMGDMNTQTASESCFQQLINSTSNNTKFFDPANALGDWSDSSSNYAQYLTQSTRTTDPGDCAATGGINNRFDHILCTKYLMDGTDSLLYIPNSFTVVGQDGLHTGLALTDPPQNSSVPPYIVNALYNMSEHLPVVLQLGVIADTAHTNTTTAINEILNSDWIYNTIASNYLLIKSTGGLKAANYDLKIFDVQGRCVLSSQLNKVEPNNIPLNNLANGGYLIRISADNHSVLNGRFTKVNK